ncbi:hypothetical protein Tco_0134033 [Tanacetum coccineum]
MDKKWQELQQEKSGNRVDFEKAPTIQEERQSDTIKRYQTLKKKPVLVAQARKNMDDLFEELWLDTRRVTSENEL